MHVSVESVHLTQDNLPVVALHQPLHTASDVAMRQNPPTICVLFVPEHSEQLEAEGVDGHQMGASEWDLPAWQIYKTEVYLLCQLQLQAEND